MSNHPDSRWSINGVDHYEEDSVRLQKLYRKTMNEHGLVSLASKYLDKVFDTMSYPTNTDELVGKALGKAIRHAKSVVVREHIKATRVEGVNQFIVSIRRQLGYIKEKIGTDIHRSMSNLLENREVWHDIGVPTEKWANTAVSNLLVVAARQAHTCDAQAEEIEADLEELGRNLSAARHHLQQAERINREADLVTEELCAVFEPKC